eukprot:TRINITY_DN539_c2_g2_i1.p1 TRINITY_DN539_c2_g2~~TRINITY_DN539_c2_g2_i1.p1  ORF type:complete len:746 (+),score=340.01 TRINITY_DN539_c2_g2_i1:131-2368(+)
MISSSILNNSNNSNSSNNSNNSINNNCKLSLTVIAARNLIAADCNGFSDPYCVITFLNQKLKTKIKYKTLNPEWNETFPLKCDESIVEKNPSIEIIVYDDDLIGGPDFLGQLSIPFNDFKEGNFDRWLTLQQRKKKEKVKGDIHLKIEAENLVPPKYPSRFIGTPDQVLHNLFVSESENQFIELIKSGKYLIDAIYEQEENTILHLVAKTGSISVLEALINANANLNIQNIQSQTALHLAADNCRVEIVKKLIESGADPKIKDINGNIPLHYAANSNCPESVCEQLLQALISIPQFLDTVNTPNTEGKTPLHFAVAKNNNYAVMFLLANKANPNNPSLDGMAPLHIASMSGNQIALDLLIVNGANPAIKTQVGSCLDVAEISNQKQIMCILFQRFISTSPPELHNEAKRLTSLFVKKELDTSSIYLMSRRQSISASNPTIANLAAPILAGSARVMANSNSPAMQFVVRKKLGEGAYGTVHRVKHIQTGFNLAVKLITLDEEQRMAIEREVDILRSCTHPNIVQFYGSFQVEDKIVILMEFCSGGCVVDLLKKVGRLFTENEIACIIESVAQGLVYLHSMEIVHRDLKPHNILISHAEAKISDFGVSNSLGSKQQVNTVIGTPLFMAPEMFMGEDYNTSVDIWALAITAINLAQKFPPHHDLPVVVAIATLTKEPPNFVEPSKWSNEFIEFTQNCLQMSPKHRYTALQLLSTPFLANIKDQHKAIMTNLVGSPGNNANIGFSTLKI